MFANNIYTANKHENGSPHEILRYIYIDSNDFDFNSVGHIEYDQELYDYKDIKDKKNLIIQTSNPNEHNLNLSYKKLNKSNNYDIYSHIFDEEEKVFEQFKYVKIDFKNVSSINH